MWLQHCRKNNLLIDADDTTHLSSHSAETALTLDLNAALQHLSAMERLCITLSYQKGMTHGEISEVTETPLGTVKSHIKRRSSKLNSLLEAHQKDHD